MLYLKRQHWTHCAAVGVAVLGEVIAQQAASGIGNAHGAVDEAFQFDGDAAMDFFDIAQGSLRGP
jgi:hypothetical protein